MQGPSLGRLVFTVEAPDGALFAFEAMIPPATRFEHDNYNICVLENFPTLYVVIFVAFESKPTSVT